MRLQPPLVVIPKFATVDTVIPTAPSADGSPSPSIFIPENTYVFLNAMALHHNRAFSSTPSWLDYNLTLLSPALLCG
jgi:hypothetical protein